MILTDEQQERVRAALEWSRRRTCRPEDEPTIRYLGRGRQHVQKLVSVIQEVAKAEPAPDGAWHRCPRRKGHACEQTGAIFRQWCKECPDGKPEEAR